jgi:hypothetical protein
LAILFIDLSFFTINFFPLGFSEFPGFLVRSQAGQAFLSLTFSRLRDKNYWQTEEGAPAICVKMFPIHQVPESSEQAHQSAAAVHCSRFQEN